MPKTPEAFTHDADGNLTSDGRWTYTWDGENRLATMTTLASVPALAQRQIVCYYDYMSRRVRKQEFTRNPSTGQLTVPAGNAFYAWDGWTLAAELAGDGSPVRRYLWNTARGHKSLAAVRLGTGTGAASPPAQFAIVDGNDNVMRLVNGATPAGATAAEVTAVYEYGPFGEPLRVTGPAADANPVRFSSETVDAASGFYYYGYRYYNPDTGRWISRDPIAELGGASLYLFCGNTPIALYDSLGLDWLNNLANFVAGAGDALTFGLTRQARIQVNSLVFRSADDAGIDPNDGYYIAGEVTEVTVDIAVTAGGATLRHVAKRTVRSTLGDAAAIRAFRKTNKLKGGFVHHVNPIKGHPNFTGARYPLPFRWAAQGFWNLKWLPDRAAHTAAHLKLMRLEAVDRLRESTLLVRQAVNRIAIVASQSTQCPVSVNARAAVEAATYSSRPISAGIDGLEAGYAAEAIYYYGSGFGYLPEE